MFVSPLCLPPLAHNADSCTVKESGCLNLLLCIFIQTRKCYKQAKLSIDVNITSVDAGASLGASLRELAAM